MAQQENNLQIISLKKVYKKNRIVANFDITLSFKAGEVVALIGHNGAGKSTLLNQILGLVKPTSGVIQFNKVNIIDNPQKARAFVSLMPQFQAPLNGVTMKQAVESIFLIRGGRSKEMQTIVNSLLKDLQIENYALHSGDKLSGGLQRLTSFAMTVVSPSPILLFDEPTNDVDPIRRKLIWQYMKKLANNGHIVLVVSHNVLEIEQYADRYIMLEEGQVIKESDLRSYPAKSVSLLSIFILDTDILSEIPVDIEIKYTEKELRADLILNPEQILNTLDWALQLLKLGRISNYKLSPISLEYSYGGLKT
ncbi:ABC transporter ATP-binding protein [Niallia taxi]|uniref:ATP-binding cassette domain-containing protein n=1 Tax=Niallia taxi TaxID=2499688 RepID=UPI003981C530